MKKLMLMGMSVLSLGAGFQAKADGPAPAETGTYPNPKCRAVADNGKMSGYCWDNDAMAPKDYELTDGTKISVEDKDVYIVAPDGQMSPAPDGEHIAKDGTTLTTKGGLLVE